MQSEDDDPHGRPVLILVAVDFAAASQRAVEWAGALSQGRPAEVHAVHAIDPTPLAHAADSAEMLVAATEEHLRRFCLPVSSKGIRVEVHAETGRPADVVRSVAAHVSPDLVIAGNCGMSSVRRMLVGSNADRIARSLPAPVLVVRADDEPRAHLRVLVATDFSQDAAEAIAAFRHIFNRSMIRLEVRVVHAMVPPELVETVDVPLVERVDWPELEREAQRSADAAAALFRADGVAATATVVRGAAARTVLAEARSWRADLVVLGRRGMSAFERVVLGSTAERVLHSAHACVFTASHARVRAKVRAAYIA
jgi:nucleotide-binding universal stress UspA family protein